MNKGRSFYRWIVVISLFTIIFTFIFSAYCQEIIVKNNSRADVLNIDTLKIFGELERSEVLFLHDLHTDAIKREGKDCSECHSSENKYTVIPDTHDKAAKKVSRLSPKFKRLKDTSRQEVMDNYHDHCINCHTIFSNDDKKAGPVTCGGCHLKSDIVNIASPINFDKSLHFRHSKKLNNKCESCHHEYDKTKKELIYIKGKEGSCRYCHKEKTEDNRVSMRLASHLSCIDCHKKRLEKKEKAGPVKCNGCHDPANQKKIAKVNNIPRYERKQPDLVIVKTGQKELKTRMNPVPFNHKAHEEYNEKCLSCHHTSLEACSKCHSINGTKDGDHIRLDQAMHINNSSKSCIGCHNSKKQDKECAGCHKLMQKEAAKYNKESCQSCHVTLPKGVDILKAEDDSYAKKILPEKISDLITYDEKDIPDKVVIKDMVNVYDECEFPHRKVVNTLLKGMNKSNLSKYFHVDKAMVCQGCHHNSPSSINPPKCGHCHGNPFNENNITIPGKMAAYHRQCIGCHQEMEIKKAMGCTDCHKKRKLAQKD